jgi:hypothetical protein
VPEQPLFIIAFALQPTYRNTVIELLHTKSLVSGQIQRTCFCISRLVEAAKLYYTKHKLFLSTTPADQENELNRLGKQFRHWLKGTALNMDTYDLADNELEYWNDQKESFPSLANLAMFFVHADVHSSNCERVFKEFAKHHTKARNRLKQRLLTSYLK